MTAALTTLGAFLLLALTAAALVLAFLVGQHAQCDRLRAVGDTAGIVRHGCPLVVGGVAWKLPDR